MNRRRARGELRGIDLFCGAGGLSWGLVRYLERRFDDFDVQLAAVNHWEVALETHQRNHPWATHYHSRVDALRPRAVAREVFGSERVDVLVGGPQCTHFSKARGGRPVEDQKRSTPWDILNWCQKLYVDNVLLENVPEFEQWGPVGANGRPLESKRGETFEAYVNALHSLGYSVDWRVLNAADYGDATTRRRLFLVARRNHRPEWPAQTHSEGGKRPDTEPWRPAAEIIDWSDPGESIWTRDLENDRVHQPLKNTTMKRMAEGIRRYGDESLAPFADVLADIGRDDVYALRDDAVGVEEAAEVAEDRDEPFLVRGPVVEPNTDVFGDGDGGGDGDGDGDGCNERYGLCVPYLLGQQGGAVARDTERPCPTIATDGYVRLFRPEAFVLPRLGRHGGDDSNPAYPPEDRPLHTVTSQNHDGHLFWPFLVPFYGERDGQDPRTHDIGEPLPTVPASKSPAGVCWPFFVTYYGESDVDGIDEPLPTVTTRDRFALCLPEHYPWGLDVRFRLLQPRELAAAMGFPPDYEFCGTKTDTTEQIGNAVPVNLAAALCETLLEGREPTLGSFTGGEMGVADD